MQKESILLGEWYGYSPRCQQTSHRRRCLLFYLQLKFRRSVGKGIECYKRCQGVALQWEFQAESMGIVAVKKETNCAEGDPVAGTRTDGTPSKRSLVTYSRRKVGPWKLYVVNPVHVVYDTVDDEAPMGDASTDERSSSLLRYTSTAYATGRGHWIRGEERVSVCYRNNGVVDVEILSVSKPARSIMGYLVWPFLGRMQKRFFLDQMQHFQDKGIEVFEKH